MSAYKTRMQDLKNKGQRKNTNEGGEIFLSVIGKDLKCGKVKNFFIFYLIVLDDMYINITERYLQPKAALGWEALSRRQSLNGIIPKQKIY